MPKYEFEITLQNKQKIADASKKFRAYTRMANSPKVEHKSFTRSLIPSFILKK